MPMTWDAALARLQRDSAAGVFPEIAYEDLVSLLAEQELYTVWAPSTAYALSAVVAPTDANATTHIYRCVLAGTSGTAEPSWPQFSTVDPRPGQTRPYWAGSLGTWPSGVADGTAQWVEHGPLPDAPWNIRKATANAWGLKAQIASVDVAYRAGNVTIGPDTTHARCLAERARWDTDLV